MESSKDDRERETKRARDAAREMITSIEAWEARNHALWSANGTAVDRDAVDNIMMHVLGRRALHSSSRTLLNGSENSKTPTTC